MEVTDHSNSMRPLVLLGFAEALSSPEVTWSLVDGGFRVVAFARKGRKCPLRHSRHVTIFEVAAPEIDLNEARKDLSALLSIHRVDALQTRCILFPLDDTALWLCSQQSLPLGWVLAGPRDAAVKFALDKSTQTKIAGEAGLNVPDTSVVTRAEQVRDSVKQWPVMLKPADAVLPNASYLGKGANWICADAVELDHALDQWREKYPLLLQPFIAGTGEGVFGLSTAGGVQCWSSHRRLRMMNPHGSGSSACISQPVPEALKEPIQRMIKESGWIGLFMVELLRDYSGKYWFVEFNGRPWGSMALSRRQGLEYPAWAAQLAQESEFQIDETKLKRSEVTCRNLGREFMHLLFVLRGRKSTALQEWPSFWSSAAKVLSIRPRDSLYNFRSDDLKVFVSDFFCTISDQSFKGANEKQKGKVKAACHIHSEWSYDGKWSLSKLAAQFGRRGYRVLLMTEHDRGFTEDRLVEYRQACAQASSDSVLVVPGIEYSDASNTVHVLVWGPVPFLGENLPTTELLAKVKGAGGVAVLAHPSRRNAWKNYDPSWAKHLLGIEVWNRKTDGWAPSPTARPLLQGINPVEFVGMDFHDRKQFFPLAMELEVASPTTEDMVIECLKARCCRPIAFGSPLNRSCHSWRRPALLAAECCRQKLASTYRWLGGQFARKSLTT